jgi:hypothetical protein
MKFQDARNLQKSPLLPLFQRGRLFSSLYKREAGRDFWDG